MMLQCIWNFIDESLTNKAMKFNASQVVCQFFFADGITAVVDAFGSLQLRILSPGQSPNKLAKGNLAGQRQFLTRMHDY
jgi:hypothetical protein